MQGVADEGRCWAPEDGIQRLRMAADRLCPARVLGGTHYVAGDGDPAVTLWRAIALCEGTDLNPREGDGRFLLVLGIRHEIRKALLVLAALAGGAAREQIERDAHGWLESQTTDVENEIAARWGEPAAGLIRRNREQPDFFDWVLAEYASDP